MKKPNEKSAIETLVVHGIRPGFTEKGSVVPPLHLTSTFKFENADQGAEIFSGSRKGYVYSRISNPTVDLLQQKVALLEGGEAAVATASGMAAIASAMMTFLRPGDNFVSSATVYGGTFALFNEKLNNFGIEARFLPPALAPSVKNLIPHVDRKTRLLFIETPANPTLDVIDIAKWATLAKKHRILLVVDNTFATPYLQNPLVFGADLVVHSATKYLGGHADVIGGLVVGEKQTIDRINTENIHHFGPIISPFNAWLILRGIKTLAVRMDRHCENAMSIARFLADHPKVKRVFYPGLISHASHGIASKQMKHFGGMLAFEVKGGLDSGKTVMDSVKLCTLAVSLGDCDTLIQHPASMTHSPYPQAELEKANITEGLIRLSVGIENAEDIIADLDQALHQI